MGYSNPTNAIDLAAERNSFRLSDVERNSFRYPNSLVKRTPFRYSDASQTPSRPALAINGMNSALRRRNGMNSVLRGAAKRRPRSGFTLIELLIVIGIMLVLVAAAATLIQPAGESRRIRETSRSINIYLSTARNHAMETGRSCGVIFRCLNGTACALTADQCEVPPPWAGDTNTSTATIRYSGAGSTYSVTFSDGKLPEKFIRPFDLLQFNGQGPLYTVAATNPVDSGFVSKVGDTSQPLSITLDTSQGQMVPWTTTGSTVPFCITRAPVKSVSRPLQLPAGAVVDLGGSGVGTDSTAANFTLGAADLTIMFSPTGAVDCIYVGSTRQPVTDPVYLLIGKRGLVNNGFVQNNTNVTTMKNWQDLNNLWVTINSQTGAIETEPVAVSSDTAELKANAESRKLAKQGQGMGGK